MITVAAPVRRLRTPCHWLCTACGFLVAQTSATPPSETAPTRDVPCPRCGTIAWADLRDAVVVDALSDLDDDVWRTHGQRPRAVLGWLGGMLIVAFGTLALAAEVSEPSWVAVAGLAAAFGLACAALARRLRRTLRTSPERPARWQLAPAPEGPVRRRVVGTLEGDHLVHAPLSGMRCLAWQLGVRHPTDDAGAWTWKLLAQGVARAEVDGVTIDPRTCRLQCVAVGAPCDLTVPRTRALLRWYGIDPAASALRVYETVLLRGFPVALDLHEGASVLRA